jgi:hypothetical protein
VAGLPAAGQVGPLDLVVLQHEGQLHLVVLVHLLAAAGGRLLPAEAQVEVGAVVGGLHVHGTAAALPLIGLGSIFWPEAIFLPMSPVSSWWQLAQDSPFLRARAPPCSVPLVIHSIGETPG